MKQPDDEAFRSLVERAADVVLLLDADGAITYANPAAEELFGRPRSELVGERFGSVATSEQRSEVYVLHPRRGLVATNIRRVSLDVAGRPRVAVYLRDVTERVLEEERLRQFAVVFDAIGEGVIITGPDTVIVAVNHAFTSITGYPEEEAIGRTPEFLYDNAEFYKETARVLERQGHWDGELRKHRKDGEMYLEELSINAVHRDTGELIHYVGVFTDVTGVRNLRHRADHDPLTGLYNRYAFQNQLDEEIRRIDRYGGSFSLIMLDLDYFKTVNDRYGHDVGDQVLRRVSALMQEEVRDPDIITRWGGEEFMILLPETDIDNAIVLAERIRTRIAETDFEGPDGVTISLGLAGSHAGESEEMLIRRVDRALYRAKASGRNRAVQSECGEAPEADAARGEPDHVNKGH